MDESERERLEAVLAADLGEHVEMIPSDYSVSIEVEGIHPRCGVSVDFYKEQPRLIVHADPDREEPSHVIPLPEYSGR